MGVAAGPVLGEAHGSALGHLDEGEGLAASDEELGVADAADFEGAPEAGALHFFEASVDNELVGESGGFAVVDFGADDDGEELGLGHFTEGQAELGGEAGAGGLDHAEVGDVVDDAAAIGVEEHDFLTGFDDGGVGRQFGHGDGGEVPLELAACKGRGMECGRMKA